MHSATTKIIHLTFFFRDLICKVIVRTAALFLTMRRTFEVFCAIE